METPAWFLKEFAFAIADLVCHIFTESFGSGLVLDIWKRVNVLPITKISNPRSPSMMTFDPFHLLRR
jgi:hypothetical protein